MKGLFWKNSKARKGSSTADDHKALVGNLRSIAGGPMQTSERPWHLACSHRLGVGSNGEWGLTPEIRHGTEWRPDRSPPVSRLVTWLHLIDINGIAVPSPTLCRLP